MKQVNDFKQKELKAVVTATVPQHPYMAPNGYSNTHCDAYMTDTYKWSGPLGKNYSGTIYTKRYQLLGNDSIKRFLEICVTVAFNKSGQLISLGNRPDQSTGETLHELLLLDPTSLKILASYQLPEGGGGSSNFGCSGYFYLDNQYRVVVPQADGLVGIYEVVNSSGNYSFSMVGSYDPKLPANSSMMSALPDWSGRLWVITTEGCIACIDPQNSSNPYSIQLSEGEIIVNSFAVDETGGVFVASDHAMYRFDYDSTAENPIVETWSETYDRGVRTKPGQKSQGTGTTPTRLNIGGVAYVAITDNADPQMNVMVYKSDKDADSPRVVGQVPVFTNFKSDTENSLIGLGSSFIVENNYGYTALPNDPPKETTTPGLASVKLTETPGMETFSLNWNNPTISIPSLVTKASVVDGLIYSYSMEVVDGVSQWYFSVVDFNTGELYFQQFVGKGEEHDNYYAAIVIHPTTGDAYVPVWGGFVRISNKAL